MLSYKMDFSFCACEPGFVKSSHKFGLRRSIQRENAANLDAYSKWPEVHRCLKQHLNLAVHNMYLKS